MMLINLPYESFRKPSPPLQPTIGKTEKQAQLLSLYRNSREIQEFPSRLDFLNAGISKIRGPALMGELHLLRRMRRIEGVLAASRLPEKFREGEIHAMVKSVFLAFPKQSSKRLLQVKALLPEDCAQVYDNAISQFASDRLIKSYGIPRMQIEAQKLLEIEKVVFNKGPLTTADLLMLRKNSTSKNKFSAQVAELGNLQILGNYLLALSQAHNPPIIRMKEWKAAIKTFLDETTLIYWGEPEAVAASILDLQTVLGAHLPYEHHCLMISLWLERVHSLKDEAILNAFVNRQWSRPTREEFSLAKAIADIRPGDECLHKLDTLIISTLPADQIAQYLYTMSKKDGNPTEIPSWRAEIVEQLKSVGKRDEVFKELFKIENNNRTDNEEPLMRSNCLLAVLIRAALEGETGQYYDQVVSPLFNESLKSPTEIKSALTNLSSRISKTALPETVKPLLQLIANCFRAEPNVTLREIIPLTANTFFLRSLGRRLTLHAIQQPEERKKALLQLQQLLCRIPLSSDEPDDTVYGKICNELFLKVTSPFFHAMKP